MRRIIFALFSFVAVCFGQESVYLELPKSPVVPMRPAVEKYWGIRIEDHFRNLEDLGDSTVMQWYKDQSLYADRLLKKISGRKELIQRMIKYDARKSFRITSIKITENDEYFYLKRKADENVARLYYRKNFNMEEELLYDPKDFRSSLKHEYIINYIQPSWNGSYTVVAMTHSGAEISEMIIIDMKTRKPLKPIITHCWPSDGGGVSWLPDNKSFIYLHYPIIDPRSEMFLKNMKSVLYTIGDDPAKLNIILSAETNPELKIKPEDFPVVNLLNNNDKFVIGYIAGATAYCDAYYAKVTELKKDKINWFSLYNHQDKVSYQHVFKDDEFIFLTAKNSPNFRIASKRIKKPDTDKTVTLIKEKEKEVIDDLTLTRDGLFYVTSKNGVEAKLYYYNWKKERQVKLPEKSGRLQISSKGSQFPEIWIRTMGWVNDFKRYRYNKQTDEFIEENLAPVTSFPEFEDLTVEEVLVKSHDGEEVPLSIIRKKNTEKNGKNSTLLYGYGSYGFSINPFFSTNYLTWVEDGGILCIAHVRGGGEKGDFWYSSGRKTTKPNTWKDLIACTEYMIDQGYTSSKHTAIWGGSAGGILIGRAMTERPDLFAVAIPEVGVMNPLRNEITPNGPNNTKEFGSSKDSLECMALIKMDSYLKIKKDERYPATLITAGMNDPRVIAWQPGKFAAKLQAYNSSNKPIVFYVDFESGHGIDDTKIKSFEQLANVFSFAFWQTGHPKYKINNSVFSND